MESNDSMNCSPPPSPPRQRCGGNFAILDHEEMILNVLQRLGSKCYKVLKELTKQPELANEEWEVDKLLDICTDDGEWYKLKWKDWPASFASWERADLYKLDPFLITEYRARVSANPGSTDIMSSDSVEALDDNNGKPKRSLTNEELVDMSRSLAKHMSWKLFLTVMQRLDRQLKLEIFRKDEAILKTDIVRHHIAIPCGISTLEQLISLKMISRKRLEWMLSKLENIRVEVVNEVDDEPIPVLPEGFEYLVTNRYNAPDISPDALESVVGCNCRSCGPSTRKCCSQQAGVPFAYRDDVSNTLLDVQRSQAIYECTSKCKCTPETCSNRVLQKGLTIPMQLFKTNGRGWGLRTLRQIKRGEFVIEYVGEVITSAQADERKGNQYLFDLDYNAEGESNYTIDAMTFGNLSRFINSRCEDANLSSLAVYVECVHPDLPRIGFFANRDIESLEELTFDYMLQGGMTGVESCLCGSLKCRGTINMQSPKGEEETVRPSTSRERKRLQNKATVAAATSDMPVDITDISSPIAPRTRQSAHITNLDISGIAPCEGDDQLLGSSHETIDLMSPPPPPPQPPAINDGPVTIDDDDEGDFDDSSSEVWHHGNKAHGNSIPEVISLSDSDIISPMKPASPIKPVTPTISAPPSNASVTTATTNTNPPRLVEQNPNGRDEVALPLSNGAISGSLTDDGELAAKNQNGIDLLSDANESVSSAEKEDVLLPMELADVSNGFANNSTGQAINGEQTVAN